MIELLSYVYKFIKILVSFIGITFNSIVSGFEFLFGIIGNIPTFIYRNVISELPGFFRTGLYGVLGVFICAIAIKIISYIKI